MTLIAVDSMFGGVRQGCVLSPRLFSSVLEMALSSWRAKMEAEGLSLEDVKPLLDLRFADDILLFCTTLDKTRHKIGWFKRDN